MTGNNVGDQYRSFGGNQDNRGNWNNSGQSNWSNQGNWSGGGGWGDWNGPRNNPRRGDDGPHIPPFPQAWQHGQQHMNQGGNRNEMKGWGGGNKWNQVGVRLTFLLLFTILVLTVYKLARFFVELVIVEEFVALNPNTV